MQTTKPKLSYGTMLRARRLRWNLINFDGRNYFLRLSPGVGSDAIYAEFCPAVTGAVPLFGVVDKHFLFIGTVAGNPDLRDAVMDSSYIRCIKSVKRYFAIVIDDDGNFVRDVSPRTK